MGKEETAEALAKLLADDDVAEAVADGDFTQFADADLTAAERALLEAAASEHVGEVGGFGKAPQMKNGPRSEVGLNEHLKGGPALKNTFDYLGDMAPQIFKF